MRWLQTDPTTLEPIGGTAVGIWLPALTLVASIVISWYLYWYFGRRVRVGKKE